MLLFDPIYDRLISAFIEYHKLSTQELHTYINKHYQISLPNLYKVIAKLLDDQILVKETGKLSLHSRRVEDFSTTANKLKEAYLETSYNINLKEGEIINFQANSIKDMDGIR